jgi:hypothetical protein
MDDTSIQFRLRMAQINGINLDEAEKKSTKSLAVQALDRAIDPEEKESKRSAKSHRAAMKALHRMNKNYRMPDDSYHRMEQASSLIVYHKTATDSIRNGKSPSEAHKEAMEAVANEHGQSGIDHVRGHFSELKFDRDSDENK